MYACWKSRGSTDARGRISIQLSMEELPIEVPNDATEKHPTLRGWWDYVPTAQTAPVAPPSDSKHSHPTHPGHLSIANFLNRKAHKSRPMSSKHPRHRISETPSDRQLIAHSNGNTDTFGRTSPTPSSLSRLGKLVPHMELFQKVMKDEVNEIWLGYRNLFNLSASVTIHHFYYCDLCRCSSAGSDWSQF
jgi:hypothetical protein